MDAWIRVLQWKVWRQGSARQSVVRSCDKVRHLLKDTIEPQDSSCSAGCFRRVRGGFLELFNGLEPNSVLAPSSDALCS